MRIFCIVKYVGTSYKGWQKQIGKPSVESTIEDKLSSIFNETIKVVASGRTDAGVHALGQTFHFDVSRSITQKELFKILYALNRLLPKDIHVLKMDIVNDDFHARFSSKSKEYLYVLNIGEEDPFMEPYCINIYRDLDIEKMKECAKEFIGTHNFQNFTSKDEDEDNYVRTIFDISFHKKKNLLIVKFSGDGFMRYMVRNLMGTLLQIGENKIDITDVKNILNNKNRVIVHYKAPAQGLYLYKVNY